MRLLTVLEIKGNYPDNILISAQKDPNSRNWTSLMYMIRDKDPNKIHKLMLSFDGFGFKSEEDAISKMKEIAEKAVNHGN